MCTYLSLRDVALVEREVEGSWDGVFNGAVPGDRAEP